MGICIWIFDWNIDNNMLYNGIYLVVPYLHNGAPPLKFGLYPRSTTSIICIINPSEFGATNIKAT